MAARLLKLVPLALGNDEIEVACDALWCVKLQGVVDEAQEQLWMRLQPVRTGDYGGSAAIELDRNEECAVARALRFVADRVELDGDERLLLERLASNDAA